MPEYHFYCPPELRRGGCVESICCASPFIGRNAQGQNVPNAAQTWQWLSQQNLQFPPGVNFKCRIINGGMSQERAPYIYCLQYTMPPPQVSPVQVSAPYGTPVGNRGQGNGAPLGLPPVAAGQRRPGEGPSGALDPLPDAALPGNSDPMLGDNDGMGGTYTDIDGNGVETARPQDGLRAYNPQQVMPGIPGMPQ